MADYGAIVDAIDAAILAGITTPGELSVDDKTIKYRSLEGLQRVRAYYAKLAAKAAGKRGFGLGRFTAGVNR